MSFLEVPPFDALSNQDQPYAGFGAILLDSHEAMDRFRTAEKEARSRIRQIFGKNVDVAREVPKTLDQVIREMWRDGWDPAEGNINLMTADFGCVFAGSLHETLDGQFVFRSAKDVSHASLWWPDKGIEAFPFHKVYKCLSQQEGESLEFFTKALTRMLARDGDSDSKP